MLGRVSQRPHLEAESPQSLLDPKSRRKRLPTGRCLGMPGEVLLAAEPQVKITLIHLGPADGTRRKTGFLKAECY